MSIFFPFETDYIIYVDYWFKTKKFYVVQTCSHCICGDSVCEYKLPVFKRSTFSRSVYTTAAPTCTKEIER